VRSEEIRYADVGDLQIAYRVLGEGDPDGSSRSTGPAISN
jgi:hypothetical protein